MAKLEVPVQVNLPEDWLEQILDRLKNDPESEWTQVVHCRDCKYNSNTGNYTNCDVLPQMFGRNPEDNYCSYAERREE